MEEKKRGGARTGAGRPKKTEEAKRCTVSFVCTQSEKEIIEQNSTALGVSKSEYICSRLFR